MMSESLLGLCYSSRAKMGRLRGGNIHARCWL